MVLSSDIKEFYDSILKNHKHKIDKTDIVIKKLEELSKLTLHGKDHSLTNQETFFVNVCDNLDNIILFLCWCAIYYNISKTRTENYVGIDYEFNERKIALAQLCFFYKENKNYVWVIDPREFNSAQTDLFIKYLYTNKHIYKILHGADSLDTPYMFTELFKNDYPTIFKYCRNFVDTRFLCEFIKIDTKQESKKCSIYDALLYFKVLSKEKYDYLMTNHEHMDPIYKLQWNILHLKSFQLEYAVYDVFYLKDFLIQMMKTASLSIQIVPELTRFVFLEKYEIINLTKELKPIVDKMNIYRIKSNKPNKYLDSTLVTTYNKLSTDLSVTINEYSVDLNTLIQINYFKTPLTIILKYFLYSYLVTHFNVLVNSSLRYQTKMDTTNIYNTFDSLGMKNLILFFTEYEKKLKNIYS